MGKISWSERAELVARIRLARSKGIAQTRIKEFEIEDKKKLYAKWAK